MTVQSLGTNAEPSRRDNLPSLIERIEWRFRRHIGHRPEPGSIPSPQEPVHVVGMFRTASGLGYSARACADALELCGADVRRIDVSGLLNQADMAFEPGLTTRLSPDTGTAIVHVNPPEFERVLFGLGLRRWHRWHIIAYWAWELERVPAEWSTSARLASEIWTPSDFVARAIQLIPCVPVRTIPHYVKTPEVAFPERPPGAPFHCLIMADGRSSFERKNIEGSVKAFHAAFANTPSARLTVKCRNLKEFRQTERTLTQFCSGDSRIELYDGSWPREKLLRLMADCDAIISCHRAEGFGLHLAEAMALGKPVVATGWSGNLQFMDEANSILVPYRLTPVNDAHAIYGVAEQSRWAEPDTMAAGKALSQLASESGLRRRIGQAAVASIRQKLTPECYINALYTPV